MRILFDKNVPVGARRFLHRHEVHTFVEMRWPDQLVRAHGEAIAACVDAVNPGAYEFIEMPLPPKPRV